MNGRVENDLKIYNSIEVMLCEFPKYVKSWYFYLKANGKTATSCRDYIRKIRKFLEYINDDIKDIKVSDFNEDIITGYLISIRNKSDTGAETSISYKQCVWSCLKNFFDFLYKRRLIKNNYFELSGISRPKGNDLKEINSKRILLTEEDFKHILHCVDSGAGTNKAKGYQKKYRNRDKAIFMLFMTTGMRKTALQEINVNDIDLENHKLYIIDKGHKSFTYYLNDSVVDILNEWINDRYYILGRKDSGALFISKEKSRMSGNAIADLIDKYSFEALGYHISPHKLRSGFASILYNKKHDLEYVRRAIGHSNITTTQRYVVTDNTEREEAANIISGLFS